MAVMPIARLFFACAHAEQSVEGRRITIIDPIDSVMVPQGLSKFSLGPVYFYVQAKEGLGTFYFRIEVRNERGRRLAKTKPREIVFSEKNHNVAEELVFKISDLQLDSAGIVQFDLYANELVLASWEVRILIYGE